MRARCCDATGTGAGVPGTAAPRPAGARRATPSTTRTISGPWLFWTVSAACCSGRSAGDLLEQEHHAEGDELDEARPPTIHGQSRARTINPKSWRSEPQAPRRLTHRRARGGSPRSARTARSRDPRPSGSSPVPRPGSPPRSIPPPHRPTARRTRPRRHRRVPSARPDGSGSASSSSIRRISGDHRPQPRPSGNPRVLAAVDRPRDIQNGRAALRWCPDGVEPVTNEEPDST